MLATLAALIAIPSTTAPEAVNLIRRYTANETHAYALQVNAEQGGSEMSVKTEIVFKIGKVGEKEATVSMSQRKFEEAGGGGVSGPDPKESLFGAEGIPHSMSVRNFEWIYIIASFPGLLPGKEVEVGKSFELNWTSKDGNSSVKGKGKVLEVAEVDGEKNAKIEYDLEVGPEEQDSGHVKMTNIVRMKDLVGLMSEGSVEISSGPIMKFTVKRLGK